MLNGFSLATVVIRFVVPIKYASLYGTEKCNFHEVFFKNVFTLLKFLPFSTGEQSSDFTGSSLNLSFLSLKSLCKDGYTRMRVYFGFWKQLRNCFLYFT